MVKLDSIDSCLRHNYTIRMFPPAIDIIPTSLAVVYSYGKYRNYKINESPGDQPHFSFPSSAGQTSRQR